MMFSPSCSRLENRERSCAKRPKQCEPFSLRKERTGLREDSPVREVTTLPDTAVPPTKGSHLQTLLYSFLLAGVLASANGRVRSARSEMRELSYPLTELRIKSCKGSIQRPGNPRVPWSTPKAEPAVAPLQSVSHPPWTANPIVLV